VIKIYLFRFRVAWERINYLLLDVKAGTLKKFDINPLIKISSLRRNMWSNVELILM